MKYPDGLLCDTARIAGHLEYVKRLYRHVVPF